MNWLFLEAGVSLTGDAAELAKTHEWGVMIAALIFCACLSGALLYGAFKFAGEIVSLYKHAIEANTKLSVSIDKLGLTSEQSNKELQEFTRTGFDTLGKALSKIGDIVEDHEGRIGGLETTVYDKGGPTNE